MNGSQNQPSGTSKVLEAIVAAATIVAGVAAIISLKDKAAIIVAGVIGALILGAIAIHALRRSDKPLAGAFGVIAIVFPLVTVGYGLSPVGSGATAPQPTYSSQQPSPTNSRPQPSPAAPAKEQPLFEGSAKIVAGQAIDLEVSDAKAKSASGVLVKPDDLRIDPYAFVFDRDGYLLGYSGNPNEGKEGCREILESGKPRGAMFALPNLWYCVLTSEGRIALIQFGQGDVVGRVGNLSYRVWNK